jgi:predicted DsbA family dithiol-disulfide isomerase
VRLLWRAFPILPEPGPARLPDAHTREAWQRAQELGEGARFTPWPDAVPLPAWSLPALEAARWVEATAPARAEAVRLALLEAHFGWGVDIADPEALVATIATLGLDGEALREALASGRYRADVVAQYEAARQAGVDAGPTVLLSDGRGRVRVVGEVPYAQYRRLVRWFLAT